MFCKLGIVFVFKSVGLKEREGMLNYYLECYLMFLGYVEEIFIFLFYFFLGMRSLAFSSVVY